MLNRSPGYDDLTQGSNALGVPFRGCFMENVYALSVSRFLQRGESCATTKVARSGHGPFENP